MKVTPIDDNKKTTPTKAQQAILRSIPANRRMTLEEIKFENKGAKNVEGSLKALERLGLVRATDTVSCGTDVREYRLTPAGGAFLAA